MSEIENRSIEIYTMNHILIVEDEIRIASFVEKGLRNHGYKTTIAADGETALQFIEKKSYDLLILDLGLPVKSGWEVLRELNTKNYTIPTIIITAQERIESIENISFFIQKPFRFQVLLNKVKACLNLI